MSALLRFFQRVWVKRITFVVALVGWFVAFQPWGGFADPDAFYHSTMAAIMLKQGVIREFAWLDLTSFAHPFVNQHFLFHAALVPFVAVFGALPGGQIAAVVFGVLFCLIFFWCLKRLQSPAPYFWTLVLATVPSMTARLSYGKASPFAVALFMLGVTALMTGMPVLAFVTGIIYVLTHAGWPLLLAVQGTLLIGHALSLWALESVPLKQVLRDRSWLKALSVFGSTVIGCAIGFALHPYRVELWGFLKIQLIQVGIATPYDRVIMGNEWYGPAPMMLAVWLLPFLAAMGVFVLGMLVARRAPKILAMRYAIMLALPIAFLFALTLKSARFIEYLVPMLTAFVAQLFHQVDVRKIRLDTLQGMGRSRMYGIIGFIVVILIVQRGVSLSESHSLKKPFDVFSGAMGAIRQEMKPGERLFHADWSQMPMLWAQNQEIRYVAGLDPTFLLAQNPDLSDRYVALTTGKATSTAYDVIVHEMRSSAVFIDRERHEAVEDALKLDARFERIYEDATTAVYRINP